jgi:hypothetical protein
MMTKQPHPANIQEDLFRGCSSTTGCGGVTGGVTGATGEGEEAAGIGAGSRTVGA